MTMNRLGMIKPPVSERWSLDANSALRSRWQRDSLVSKVILDRTMDTDTHKRVAFGANLRERSSAAGVRVQIRPLHPPK